MSGQPRQSALRRSLGGIAGCVLTSAILAWIWRRHGLDLTALIHGSRHANAAIVAIVFISSAAFGLLIGAHKLHLVLRSMGAPIRYRETLLVRLGSAPARVLLPFASGDLMQVFCFRAAARLPLARASGAVVFDKGTNFIGALLWLAVGSALLSRNSTTPESIARAMPMLSCALGITLPACLVAVFATPAQELAVRWVNRIHPRLADSLSGVLEPFRQLEFSRKLMLIGYGVLFQARPLVVCYALLAAVDRYPGIQAVLASSAAAVCAGYAPGFVAGSGPREAVLLELLGPSGVPPEAGFFVGALMTLSVHVVPAIIGAPWTLWMLRSLRARPCSDVAQEAP